MHLTQHGHGRRMFYSDAGCDDTVIGIDGARYGSDDCGDDDDDKDSVLHIFPLLQTAVKEFLHTGLYYFGGMGRRMWIKNVL